MRLAFRQIKLISSYHYTIFRPFSSTRMAVAELKTVVTTAEPKTVVNKIVHPFDKTRFEALLNRRFFYAPAFEIYGGQFLS